MDEAMLKLLGGGIGAGILAHYTILLIRALKDFKSNGKTGAHTRPAFCEASKLDPLLERLVDCAERQEVLQEKLITLTRDGQARAELAQAVWQERWSRGGVGFKP